jgi:hypothetical protein
VYAIKACADENIKRGYCNRNIYMLSNSEAAIKELHGNEIADQLAKMGPLRPFIGPEPACGISENVARRVIRVWAARNTINTGSPS